MTFTEDFRRFIIQKLLTDDRVFKAYVNKLRPEYFGDDANHQKIVAEIRGQFSSLGERPSPDFIIQKLSKLPKGLFDACYAEMEEVMGISMKLSDRELDNLTHTFILHNSLLDALSTAIDHVEKGEYSLIQQEIKEVFDLYGVSSSLGLSPFDNDRWKLLQEEEGQRVATPWPTLNRLMFGGLALRELGFVLGREGGYKSYTLTNIARGGLVSRVPTVVYTLEMGELMWCARLISMFTGVKTREILNDPESIRVRMERIQQMLKTPLVVKQFPTGQHTVADLKSHLVSWELENNCKAGLVIVDSADLLRPEKGHKEHRHGLSEIWTSLRGWAVEHPVALWTAKHTNRYSGWQETVDEDSVAEDKTCMRIADFAMAIQQTREEYQGGMLRFGVLKWRNDKGGIEVPIEINSKTVAMKEFTD
jgi:replicative DNA helicase